MALAIASVSTAQEPAATAGNSRQASPAIAGAKKEFESIKSARDAALLPEGGMPRVTLPALPSAQGSGTPATPAKMAKPDTQKANSKNWLVDAMEKQNERGDARRDGSALRDRNGKPRIEREDAEGADSETRETAETGQGRKDGDVPSVVNPLTRYLDDWMTPQDYALLKPGLTSQFDPRAGANNAVVLNPGVAGFSGGLSEYAMGSVAAPTQMRDVPKENPYLRGLRMEAGVPVTTVNSKPLLAPPVQSPAVQQIRPPPALPSPVPARIPDFAKPATDEKYFKQLKRF